MRKERRARWPKKSSRRARDKQAQINPTNRGFRGGNKCETKAGPGENKGHRHDDAFSLVVIGGVSGRQGEQ